MASNIADDNEPILTFLARLKLEDKYSDLFLSNGYDTVGDCRGLNEEALREMGVTLPGHYRRILSKLPGCTVKKPPRQHRSVSHEPESEPSLPMPRSPAPNAEYAYEPEEVYLLHDDEPTMVAGQTGSTPDGEADPYDFLDHNLGLPVPKKPPRSPDRLRAALGNFPRIQTRTEVCHDVGGHVTSNPAIPSNSSLSAAVFQVLRDSSPKNGPSSLLNSDDDLDDDEDVPIPILQLPPSPDMGDRIRARTPSRETSSPNSVGLVLPSPPPPEWLSGDDSFLPSPPVTPDLAVYNQTRDVTEEEAYDRLTLSSSRSVSRNGSPQRQPSPQQSGPTAPDDGVTYQQLMAGHSPVERRIENRIPAYEEIGLVDKSAAQDVAPQQRGENLPVVSAGSSPAKSSPSSGAADLAALGAFSQTSAANEEAVEQRATADVTTPGLPSAKNDFGPGHNSLGDIYDTALDASATTADDDPENLYAECDDVMATKQKGRSKKKVEDVSRSSSTASIESLPRSSGSLPASVYRLRGYGLKSRECSVPVSDDSGDESKTGNDAGAYDPDDPEAIYQSIDDQSVSGRKSVKKSDSDKSRKRLKLGLGKRTKQRPISAIFDSVRSVSIHRQGSNEDLIDVSDKGLPLSGHPRSQSTSVDRKSNLDLVDVKLPDENKQVRTPEHSLLSPMTSRKTRQGWLMKHGWHEGRAPMRRRWVVFDGDELIYYESDKSELSKGIIPLEVILRVQVPQSEPKVFHILTKGGRKYIFGADTIDDSSLWTSTLVAAKMMLDKQGSSQFKPGGTMCMPYKEGHLKMDGSKIYLATKGEQLAYYKSNQEFLFGQPVARMSMKVATVKEIDKKKFQVIFPYKTFTFVADNEDDKRLWVEALNDAISEALSDYKVIEEVWRVEANRKCADCGRNEPDWSSVNLAIIICKHCAGVHRELGVHNSKVRSLKMDVKVWDDSMKTLLLELGNSVANKFWASRLPASEAITDMADKKQRSWHINSKYIEMQFTENHRHAGNQGQLNQALINAVRNNNLAEAYKLVFSGADPNCDTGKDHAKTPFRLAQYLSYNALAEFLRQNGASAEVSPEGHVTDRSTNVQKKDSFQKTRAKPPLTLRDCLWKFGGDFKNSAEESSTSKGALKRIHLKNVLQQGDFQKRMCVLENNVLKYYDPEKTNILKDDVDCAELISIGICQPDQATKAGFQYCFEVSRTTGRTYLFCAERKEIFSKWTRGLLQAILPPSVQNALRQDFEYDRVGKMWMKSQHWTRKSSEWTSTWCKLKGKSFQYFHQESRTIECIDLRRLVQVGLDLTQDGTGISVSSQSVTIPVFMLVFREKTYYFHSHTKPDTESWLAAVKKSDGDCGPRLEDQQLTSEGVPIILEKCMTYVEQFGLTTRGIYRLSGTHSKTSQLLSDFKQNARETQMHEGEVSVHDVANALKRWFKTLPGSLLTEQLHEDWLSTAQMKQEHHHRKLEWYKHLVERLPEINRNTLKVVLVHLNNVASHEKENEMSLHNLAIVFGPTLMEPQAEDGNQFLGQTSQEIACIEDLLQYYDWLFDVTEMDREKERLMLEAKSKISIATQQQNMLTTLDYDMMVPIYINSKDDKCVNYKVNMTAGELIRRICSTHGYPSKTWGLYEVILDGDAERPLHYTDHVLSTIKAWEMPSTNYLVAKHDYIRDKMRWFQQPRPSDAQNLCEAQLRMFETRKKWTKVVASLRITDGTLTMYYGKVKGTTAVPLAHYHIYVGVDHKNKPPMPRKCGFTLANRGEVTRQFCAEPESTVYRWVGLFLTHKYPEGMTPPDSPLHSNEKVDSPPRSSSDMSVTRRPHFPSLSQQDLGEAVRQAALQRQSSASEDSPRDNIYEAAQPSAFENSESPDASHQQQSQDPSGMRQFVFARQGSNDGLPPRRAPPLMSPVAAERGMLGMQLHSELSSVLKKRTH